MKEDFLHRKVTQPILNLLTQGITPEKIALSLTTGIVLGIFPVMGSTSLLCAAAALMFRLNLPAIQLVNYFVYPLQLLLIVPFIRAGDFIFRAHPAQLSLAQMIAMARANPSQALSALWVSALHGVSAWLVVAPLLMLLLYFPLAHLMRHAMSLAQKHPRFAAQGTNSCG